MIPCPLSRLWWRRYIRRGADSWQELEDFPKQTPAQQQKALSRRLLDQVQYFGRREDALPEWREAAAIQDPAELWRIWPSLPVMRKSHLQKQFIASEIGSRFGIPGKVNSSGGSTGEPVSFFHDTGMLRKSMAASLYIHQQMGWMPGMPTLILWGSDRDIRKATSWQNHLHAVLRNEHLLAGYRMTSELTDSVLELARRNRPVCIYGFTSMLEFVARGVVGRNASLPPGYVRAAWNGGEMLFQEQSELFRKAFGVPIFNRYGGRELSAMACQFKDGGPLHILRPWLFVEVVNDQGHPASPGETGRLLMTSTVNRGTPFLRYEIGDLGTYASAHCTEAGDRGARIASGSRVRPVAVIERQGDSEYLLESPVQGILRSAAVSGCTRGRRQSHRPTEREWLRTRERKRTCSVHCTRWLGTTLLSRCDGLRRSPVRRKAS